MRQRHGGDQLPEFAFVDDAQVGVLLNILFMEAWDGWWVSWRRRLIAWSRNFFPALCIFCYTHAAPMAYWRG
jgi:hypothetical protein